MLAVAVCYIYVVGNNCSFMCASVLQFKLKILQKLYCKNTEHVAIKLH